VAAGVAPAEPAGTAPAEPAGTAPAESISSLYVCTAQRTV